jgi:hypothetical protein
MDREIQNAAEFARAIGITADFMELAHATMEAEAVTDDYEQDLAESLIEENPDKLLDSCDLAQSQMITQELYPAA